MSRLRAKIFLEQTIKYTLSSLLFYSGVIPLKNLFFHGEEGVRILTYHKVNNLKNSLNSIPSKEFRKQIEYLRTNYNIVSLDDFHESMTGGKKLPKKTVAITFDDGYRDNYTNAYPILEECRVPAAIFLTADYIGTNKVMPTYEGDETKSPFLSWQEVREMGNHGITFGSHSLTHSILIKRSPEQAKREIFESKRIIERETGKPAKFFSYPRGTKADFDRRMKDMVREAGYVAAFSAISGINDCRADPFELRRIAIETGDKGYIFMKKMQGALDVLFLRDTRKGQMLKDCFNSLLGIRLNKEGLVIEG